MSKKVLIACYGNEEDRERARALSKALGLSQSALLLKLLRKKYHEVFDTKINPRK